MGQIAFRTHAFAKRLTDAGMPEPQAEMLAREQARLHESNLATKRDIAELRTEVRRDVKDLEQRLTIRFGGMMMAAVAVLAALVKLL